MSTNDPNQPGKQSPYDYGQQQPWTGPPTNAPSSGGAIVMIVMALGVMIILVVGCLGAAVGLFWFKASEMRDMEMTEQMEVERDRAEQILAMQEAQRAATASQNPAPAVDTRNQWTYERGPEGHSGVLRKQDDGSWLENRSDGAEFHFRERSRDAEFVELFDQERNLDVRIGNDHLEWRRNGQPWERGQGGAWTTGE